MQVNNQNYDIDELLKNLNTEETFLRDRGNGILLSDEDVGVLKKYNFDYQKYTNISSLLFDIEEYLNDSAEDALDLEEISSKLAERNYYQNTNK